MPVIAHTWTVIQGKLLDKVKASNRPLRLAGDGRRDSPGFNAKYCTYSLLDIETQHILAFVTIKVTETGSSSKMEVEGFRRCMEYLLDKGFQITVLATDRHVQIRSVMNKQYPETEHQFDVWHSAKNVRKKLQQKSKLRGAEDLAPWIKAICNHLWWCTSNCNGDKEWLEESWVSIVHHVINKHTFEGKTVSSCAHEEITPDIAEKKRLLVRDSKAHNALKEVILNKRLRKDIKHLSEFCHTGNWEVYHSLLLKYVPKRQEFDFDQMNARTSLAVIDHNMSQNRGRKLTDKDKKCSKQCTQR
ncbi:uncharacterized protein LOC127714210 [Mytilus californianus]|uniref:uncharacterized protein LOC127714210 n=1 Tax=Mytilus californianus TaxID=6549 RepID=UPI0022465A28|nr:uncharacterized protein LOC127714210 [Mytilus californianus]